jgi:hypothetical protein
MGTRTVRLDDQTESVLRTLRKRTGLSISEVLKRGVQAYAQQAEGRAQAKPYDVYRHLDLGSGGWALAPGRKAKPAVRELIAAKRHR